MATSLDSSSMEDVTLCSICFEKFKSPRFLPCTHSLCHGCLSSYIVNVCKSTESCLGFNCPLCRRYIPCPGAFDKPDARTRLFPLNEVLETIVKKPDGKLCDACLRENESENAIGFSLSCTEYLCKMCTKYHKRHLLSRDHTICQLNEMKYGNIFPESGNIHSCPKHKRETVKFFCNDYQQSCCSVCIGRKHRKCESIDTVEDAAKNIKQNRQLDLCITYDVNYIALSLVNEFSIDGENPIVWTGNFLSNGNFVFADYIPHGRCFIYNKDWKSTEVIDGLSYPFEAIQAGEELLVTCDGTKSIEVFSMSDLHKLRSVNINETVYGITQHNGVCYVACGNEIIKLNLSGKKLREYKVEGNYNIHISTTKDGHIVYSNCSLNTVTAITDQGDTVWQYKHIKMKVPRGLDVDSVGNIFVAARGSDNIHVLSGAGSLIRIIEDIPQPMFIKLMEERDICCVCSNRRIMKVYKL